MARYEAAGCIRVEEMYCGGTLGVYICSRRESNNIGAIDVVRLEIS